MRRDDQRAAIGDLRLCGVLSGRVRQSVAKPPRIPGSGGIAVRPPGSWGRRAKAANEVITNSGAANGRVRLTQPSEIKTKIVHTRSSLI
jgi:hypothetical protein